MAHHWKRRVSDETGPKYMRIARAIEASIADGSLGEGDQLPPQRELAAELDVTVGTVARAYQEVQDRGWVGGHVGRGTFVLGRGDLGGQRRPGATADLTLNQPVDLPVRERVRAHLRDLAQRRDTVEHLLYRRAEDRRHTEAATAWLERSTPGVQADEVLVTAGGQHGLLLALLALCEPGDTVLTERLTHPGLRAVAAQLRITLLGVDRDEEGVDPDDLAGRARASGARVACFTPVLQNPTGDTWSERRFEAIAALASELDLQVIEDDVYRNLVADAPAALYGRHPGTVLVSSISKALTGGLRVGAVAAPEPVLGRMRTGVAASMVMVSPLNAELAARLVLDDPLDDMLNEHRARVRERHELVRATLPPEWVLSPAGGLHVWMRVPDRWTPVSLLDALRRAGVLITAGDAFAVEGGGGERAVRVSIGGQLTLEAFRAALETLRDVVESPSQAPGPIV